MATKLKVAELSRIEAGTFVPNNMNQYGHITGPLDLSPLRVQVKDFQGVVSDIGRVMLERDEELTASALALLSKHHVYMLGAPGTGKSLLVREFADRIVDENNEAVLMFYYLMSRYTTPNDIWGPPSIAALKQDRYRIITDGRLAETYLAFLDEVGKTGPNIANTILTAMNERQFDNDGKRHDIPLMTLWAAANEQLTEELAALRDRFLFQLVVKPLSNAGWNKLMEMRGNNVSMTPERFISLSQLQLLQQATRYVYIPADVYEALMELRGGLAAGGKDIPAVTASDRRWADSLLAIKAAALYDGRGEAEVSDISVLRHILWQAPEEIKIVVQMINRIAQPYVQKIVDYADQAHSVMQAALQAERNSANGSRNTLVQAAQKMNDLKDRMEDALNKMRAGGKPVTARAENAHKALLADLESIEERVLDATIN